MKKKVSIITPLYNSERYVSEAINSVLNQSYKKWEMILVDDCSSDKSVSIVEKFQEKDGRIQLLKNKSNMGSGLSRNRAIDAASGDIIAFLDSDDVWHPEKLSKHLDFMEKNSSVFSHTSYGFINEEGQIIKSTYHVGNEPVDYEKLLKKTEIACLTAMFDVHKLGKMHMPPLPKAQDYALWLDILKLGVVSDPFDEELAFYRLHSASTTSKKWKHILGHWSFLRNREKLSLIASTYYTITWAIGGFVKYYLK